MFASPHNHHQHKFTLLKSSACRLILALVVLFSGCQTGTEKGTNADTKARFADYIAAYTNGVISRAATIRVKLAKSPGDSLAGTAYDGTIFSFSPAIEGETWWQDNYTLVFKPAAELPSGRTYQAVLTLQQLFPEIDRDREEFHFAFQTQEQNFAVSIDGIQLYDKTNLTRVKLGGQVKTADVAAIEAVKQVVAARQQGKPLTVNWQAVNNNTFNFTVEEVVRQEAAGKVELSLNGKPLGVSRQEVMEVAIPSLTDYKVVSVKLVQKKESYISVLFSDPLDERQNLNGMVSFTGLDRLPRLVVNLNELKVYPAREIHGNAEIVISSGLRSINGARLDNDYRTNIQFTQFKPQVRFAGSDNKSIMPSANGLALPFEAVSLKAVDVMVVKIFTTNILQYLQVNDLGEDYQLQRVGKPVVRKTLYLNNSGVTNLHNWNRFTLDLGEIISTEPGAIYQVTLGFKHKHTLYSCPGTLSEPATTGIEEDWGVPADDAYWDSYETYYVPGYNWEDRDNPCTVSYYGKERTVTKTLLASDLGIIAKRRDNGAVHVFVTNLLTTRPMAGVAIAVYDYQQQLLATAKTNNEGMATLPVTDEPFAIVAKKDRQTGYLKINDGASLSLSNFDVSGTRVTHGLKGFIYGERGVWRPADTVHLAFILRDVAGDLPASHPVVMEFYNPLGQLTTRKVSANPVGDIYRFDFTTASDAPTGNWLAKAKVGGATFSKTVKVETIKPNRLKVSLAFAKEKFTAHDRSITGNLNVRWLTGARAGNLKAEYELLLSPAKTVFNRFPNYSFDDAAKDFYSERTLVYSGKVNADGYARVTINLGEPPAAPGVLNARLFGKVYEPGGAFSISNTTIPYYPYTSFVGVKLPEGDKRGMLLTDEDHSVRIATVDANGKPISRKGVKVSLYKLDWKWWWDNSYDYISNYVGSYYNAPEASATINTTNGEGEWTLRLDYPKWGRYYVQVEDPVSGHAAGQIVYLDWPGWAGKGKRGDLDGATMLDFTTDRESYKVGDEVAISVPSTAGNRILVSLESGSKILQAFWVESKADNTPISFITTPDMAPNVYAHLTMVQPHGQQNNDLPIRLYGVQSIKVVNPATVLAPEIKMAAELRPEEVFTLEVTEKNGRAMAYTLAMVDEGLLDITNYKTPDPWSAFFAREALGIKTWDVYDDVMGAFAGKLARLLAVGGDGELEAKEEKEANRFKPVVKYLGPFYLEAGKTGRHQLKMPQYVGRVKTMVVAAADGAFGSTEVVTPVRQPLMLLATLPRVAGPGEKIKLPVNIFTLDDHLKTINLTIETNSGFRVAGNKTRTVKFNRAGDRMVYFDLETKAALGTGKVKVTARAGNLSAVYDVALNIIPRNPEITIVTDQVVDAGGSWETRYTPVGMAGLSSGTVEISTLPPLNIEQRLGYLIRYPHGCIEQTTSAVFAQLFINKLTTLPDSQLEKVRQNIVAGIARMRAFQVESGGFAYWPGGNYANNWGTNYAGHFLIEARKAGYAVPENVLNEWQRYQTRKARNWSSMSTNDDNDLVQAYRLYTLALAGKPALGAMNRMKENTGLGRKAKWRLALAYAVAGYDKQALKLVDGLSSSVAGDDDSYRYTFGSATRDRAMILETLLELDQEEAAFSLLLELAREMGAKNRWLSTQTTAYCFVAIAKYAGKFKLDSPTAVALVIEGATTTIAGHDFVNLTALTAPDKPQDIRLQNNGQAPVFARLIRSGTPIEGNEADISRNLRLSVSYTDQQGNPVKVSQLPQGTNFRATVTVSNPGQKGQYNELALTQLFPSGWEIINTRLEGTENQASRATYMDIRDDRVMHYFDLAPNQQVSFTILLNAAYQGRYYLPAISAGAMYDNDIFASKAGKWVTVVGEGR